MQCNLRHTYNPCMAWHSSVGLGLRGSGTVHQSKACLLRCATPHSTGLSRKDDTYTCYVLYGTSVLTDSIHSFFSSSFRHPIQSNLAELNSLLSTFNAVCITKIDYSIPNFRSFLFQVRVRAIDLAWLTIYFSLSLSLSLCFFKIVIIIIIIIDVILILDVPYSSYLYTVPISKLLFVWKLHLSIVI